MTAGDLLVFLTYLKNAFKPLRDLAKYTGRLAKATAAGERVLELLDREPEVRDRPGAVPAPPFQGAVCFEGVQFEYTPGHRVLRGIDLAVPAGRHVALVGPSGHGKTTLLSLLPRLYDPRRGRVLIDGRDIRDYTLESVRAQVSVVMQDTILFAATVRDNIAYGAPGATEDGILAASRLANAHDFVLALPDGYDTVLGERGATLSHGQRQRIAIARATMRNAPIIILDEPTAGLDEANARLVMEALERLIAGRTVFLITHTLSHARRADLIVVLEGGRVVEQGRHAELLHRDGLYARWCALQARVGEDEAWAVLAARRAAASAVEPAPGPWEPEAPPGRRAVAISPASTGVGGVTGLEGEPGC
jgi:ATP-binding cassette subfamily B protein